MSLLLFVLATILLVIVALLPVKIAANLIGARNTGFGACLVAVLVAVVVNLVAGHLVHYGGLVSVLVTGLVYMGILETTYVKGVLIALLQIVIAWLLKLVLVALGFISLIHVIGPAVGPATGGASWI